MKLIDTTFCHPTVISFLKISIGIPFQIVHQYLVQKPFLLNSKHIFLYLYNLISKISSQSPLMKNRILFLLFLLFCIHNIYAQPTIQWKKCYGGTLTDQSNSIHQTKDDGYIIAGFSESTNGDVTGNHGLNDYWLVKTDSLGTILWQKTYGGTKDERATFVQQTSDLGYIVSGYSQSNDGDVTGHHGLTTIYDCWILKTDSTGVIEWQKSLGGTSVDYATCVRQTADGGYIVSGYTLSINGDVTANHGSYDYWIVKLDSTGVIQWEKSYGGTSFDQANSIQQTTDGGYIVAGISQSVNGDVTGNHGNVDYWVIKIDSLGALQWQKSLGGSGIDEAYSVQQTFDGGYIVSGWSNSLNGDVIGHPPATNLDYWIVKLNSIGTIVWQKTFGGTANENALSIKQCTDYGYIIAGWSKSNNGDVTGHHGGATDDYWLLRLDSIGTKQWQISLGGTAHDQASCIQQTKDGGYVVTGSALSIDGDVTGHHGSVNHDYWVIKLNKFNLPVELITFNAKLNSKQIVDINWSTASEINNSYFTIERSSDAKNFEIVKTVAGAGNSTVILKYYSFDEKPLPGISYYRLKQTDFDGSFEYSEIISVKNNSATFNVYPNPSDGISININISGDRNEEVMVSIYDIKGREMFSKNIFKSDEENTFVLLPENKLSPGVYMIVVKNDFEIEHQSLVVK